MGMGKGVRPSYRGEGMGGSGGREGFAREEKRRDERGWGSD